MRDEYVSQMFCVQNIDLKRNVIKVLSRNICDDLETYKIS